MRFLSLVRLETTRRFSARELRVAGGDALQLVAPVDDEVQSSRVRPSLGVFKWAIFVPGDGLIFAELTSRQRQHDAIGAPPAASLAGGARSRTSREGACPASARGDAAARG
jgi:hypothetical protein